jgi:hypothetical protein
MKAIWDLEHLTTADELRLGGELQALILHFNPPEKGGGYLKRVYETAAPLLATLDRKDIEYKFTMLDSDAICAFSHPGGYIYVCRGMFQLIGEDDETALEFALGHEIAHVELKHALTCLNDPGVKKLEMGGSPTGTLTRYYLLIAPLAYPDKQEFEADRWVYWRLKRLNRSRYEILSFLRKMEGYAKRNDFEDGRKPIPGVSPVENHYRAHTATWMRLQKLQELMTPASAPPR